MNREDILEACFEYVQNRIKEITLAIDSANNSLLEDTKSSAGDKYETSREMIQQDLSRFQQQLSLANEDLQSLERIKHTYQASSVLSIGSLVEVNKSTWYFIAVSIGRLPMYPDLYVVSPKSPIGKLFLGKALGDNIMFNNQSFIINQVL
ncbi:MULTISPECIES: 3-oxoacyl-ACP synthase [Sphingobacterium]|uniref:3-oxoacyl-ACP synthase n=1 Tax=Sphingobacterium TaxID=28453 RepID=UPI0013DD6B70|nr:MULTISPECIES: 3-oxoacyl-ACP synthase [unclassified Sphingobacterium]